jgi:uncharacterized repeat protein (TIGR03803 family)
MPDSTITPDAPHRPVGGLVSDGTLLYGTTPYGGWRPATATAGLGTIYSFDPASGTIAALYRFGVGAAPGAAFGYAPVAGLLRRADGYFYGTTTQGAAGGHGSVFRFRPAASGQAAVFEEIVSFNGATAFSPPAPGVRRPAGSGATAPLMEGGDGWLYGTTSTGGAANLGTVFRLSLATFVTETLVEFTGIGGTRPGANPHGTLTLVPASAGAGAQFYGATPVGGLTANKGTIYSISPTGVYTHRHSFAATAGSGPGGTLAWHHGALWGASDVRIFRYHPSTGAVAYGGSVDNGIGGFFFAMGGTLTVTPEGVLLGTGRYDIPEEGRPFDSVFALTVAPDPSTGEPIRFPRPATLFGGSGYPGLDGGVPCKEALCRGPDGRYYGTTTLGGRGTNVYLDEGDGVVFAMRHAPQVTTLTPRGTGASSFLAAGFVVTYGRTVTPGFDYISAAEMATGMPFAPVALRDRVSADRAWHLELSSGGEAVDFYVRAACDTDLGRITGEWRRVTLGPEHTWSYVNLAPYYAPHEVGREDISGLNADPDHDGINNLLEWMRGSHPGIADGPVLPELFFDRRRLQSRFVFPLASRPWTDGWMVLESSNDLESWERSAALSLPGFMGTELSTVPTPVAAYPRRYYRMLAGQSTALPAYGIHSTGLGPVGSTDPHWQVSSPLTGETARRSFGAPWLPDDAKSGWIVPALATDTLAPPGLYEYTTTIDVPCGVDPTTFSISGRFACDNVLRSVWINNIATTIRDGNYDAWSPEFLLTHRPDRPFYNGRNNLRFVVENGGPSANPTGLRVEMAGTWARAGATAVETHNSGTGIDRLPLADGSQSFPRFTARDFNGAFFDEPYPYTRTSVSQPPSWIGDTDGSAWLCPGTALDAPPGTYTLRMTVNLTFHDHRTFELVARLAADNSCEVRVNGTRVTTVEGFDRWSPLTLNIGNARFIEGINHIDFVLTNLGTTPNPCGLRWEIIHAAARPLAP